MIGTLLVIIALLPMHIIIAHALIAWVDGLIARDHADQRDVRDL